MKRTNAKELYEGKVAACTVKRCKAGGCLRQRIERPFMGLRVDLADYANRSCNNKLGEEVGQ